MGTGRLKSVKFDEKPKIGYTKIKLCKMYKFWWKRKMSTENVKMGTDNVKITLLLYYKKAKSLWN